MICTLQPCLLGLGGGAQNTRAPRSVLMQLSPALHRGGAGGHKACWWVGIGSQQPTEPRKRARPQAVTAGRYGLLQNLDVMTDCTIPILAMTGLALVFTAAAAYVLAQPTDLPSRRQKG